MKQATRDKLNELQQRMKQAGEECDYSALTESMIDSLWLASEERPDFQELPEWISAGESCLRKAAAVPDARQAFVALGSLCYAISLRYGQHFSRSSLVNGFGQIAANPAVENFSAVSVLASRIASELLICSQGTRRLPVMLEVDDVIRIGRHTTVSFNRTLRVPEDGRDYPLPAGFGRLPICRVEDYADKVPAKWLAEGGFFIPLYQREALFLEFGGKKWRPGIAKVAVGRINAVTGKDYDERIRNHSQDYVVVPDQKWLDGINSGKGRVGQFVAMPLGQGFTIEEQLTDEARFGGFQIVVFEAKQGRFPDDDPVFAQKRERKAKQRITRLEQDRIISQMPTPQKEIMEAWRAGLFNLWNLKEREQKLQELGITQKELQHLLSDAKRVLKERLGEDGLLGFDDGSGISFSLAPLHTRAFRDDQAEMGIAKGGNIRQVIAGDTYGPDSWDEEARGSVSIHIVNSKAFEFITGKKAPPSPITAEKYAKCKIPWFDAYDEHVQALPPARLFQRVKGVIALLRAKGKNGGNDDSGVELTPERIIRIKTPTLEERVRLLAEQAEASWASGRFKVAHRESSFLLDLQRKHARALEIRADCNNKLCRYLEAEADASECLEFTLGSVSAMSSRAYANLRLGAHELAQQDATAALDHDPVNSYILRVRAEANYHLGLHDEALADASVVLASNPNSLSARQLRAECLRLKGMLAEAIDEATQALAAGGQQVFTLNTRAAAFLDLKRPADARKDVEAALKIEPENATALKLLECLMEGKTR